MRGSVHIKTIAEEVYSVMVTVAFGAAGKAKTIAGIQNVDVVLRAIGVPMDVRAKALDEVKAGRVGNTGVVQLSGDELRRLGMV
jgi:hypothetical protein